MKRLGLLLLLVAIPAFAQLQPSGGGSAVSVTQGGNTAVVNASGALSVNCVSGCVAGGSFADSTAFTFGTTTVGNTSFVVDDVATNAVAENSAGAARMSGNRILYIDLSKTAANAIAVKVDGSAATQPVSGTFWQATQPVSIATMPSTPVTGTFWQATQPVSGTVAATESGTWTVQPGNTANSTPWLVTDSADGSVAAGTAAGKSDLIGCVFNTTSPALTNAQQVAGQCDTSGALVVTTEGHKNSYRAAKSFAAVAGDIAVLPGSATKTIKVMRAEVSCSTSGTTANADLQLIKRSTADTAGTSAAMTAVPLDANDAAATAAPLNYTAAPTLGTALGPVSSVRILHGTAAILPTWYSFPFGVGDGAQQVTLRGVAQELAVNLSAAVATETCSVVFAWTEE